MDSPAVEKKRAENRVFYLAHREERIEAARLRKKAHPEETRAADRARYRRDPERVLAAQRRLRLAHPERFAATLAASEARYPEKIAARAAVAAALRNGRLTRRPCEVCGAEKTQAHHPFGYSEDMKLAVWWLCPPHHGGMHAAIRGV